MVWNIHMSQNVIQMISHIYMIYNMFFLHNRDGVQSSNYYSFFHFLTIKSIFYFQLLITTITKMWEPMIQQPRTLGFWSFENFNETMIAELALWILSDKDSFCIEIVRAKYRVRYFDLLGMLQKFVLVRYGVVML